MIGNIRFTLNQRLNNHITDMIGEAMRAVVEKKTADYLYDNGHPVIAEVYGAHALLTYSEKDEETAAEAALAEVTETPAECICEEYPEARAILEALSFLAKAYSLTAISEEEVEAFINEHPTKRQIYKACAA